MPSQWEICPLRSAGKAAKHIAHLPNPALGPQYGCASRLMVGHLQHHLQQPFLLVIPVGVSSIRFFPGLSFPEVLTALAAQEALEQLGPTKLCVSLFIQAILGKLLFEETWTPLWWVGMSMTVCGLMLLHTAAPQLVQVPAEKKE